MITLVTVSTCIFFANIFDIMNRTKTSIIPFFSITNLALLKIPFLVNELLPIAILIACLSFFEKFSKRNELIIMFSDGISVWKFIQPLIVFSALIGLISLFLFQPLAAYCLSAEKFLENKIAKIKTINTVSLSDGGLYISEYIDNQHRIYSAKTIAPETFSMSNVTILFLNDDGHFINRIDAKLATLKNKKFDLPLGGSEIDVSGKSVSHTFMSFNTNLDFENILDRFSSPDNISFWKLGNLSHQLINSGINADKFVSYYYKLLFRPIYIVSVILVASCFINLNPRGRIGIRVLGLGAIVGLITHSFREILTAYLISNDSGYVIAQLVPSIIIIVVSITLIVHKFET